MTAVASVEIKDCTEEDRYLSTIVDLGEPKNIGLDPLNCPQTCYDMPSGIVKDDFVDLVVRKLGKTHDGYHNLIAKVSIECPETRCPFHKNYIKPTPQS